MEPEEEVKVYIMYIMILFSLKVMYKDAVIEARPASATSLI